MGVMVYSLLIMGNAGFISSTVAEVLQTGVGSLP